MPVAQGRARRHTLGISIAGRSPSMRCCSGKLPYDPARLAYVTMVATQPSALAVNARLGVSTVAELVALLKRSPGKLQFRSIANGSVSHLAMERSRSKSGTQIVHVPYTSSPQAMTPRCCAATSRWLACPRSRDAAACVRRVKILAVSTAAARHCAGIPTLRESGITSRPTPGTASWRGGNAGRHCGRGSRARVARSSPRRTSATSSPRN